MISKQEIARINLLIDETINKLDLHMKNLTVLTEAATGYYSLTPIIAAKAGAKVIAVAKTSRYGKKMEVIKDHKKIAQGFAVSKQIKYQTTITASTAQEVDIVTNSKSLRPIDSKLISNLKENSVISLMYEKWEFRDNDIDIKLCKKNNITVVGVNEDSPYIQVFDYTQPLIQKMIFDAGLEIYQNNCLLIGCDKFASRIKKGLLSQGAHVVQKSITQDITNITLPLRLDAVVVACYCDPSKKIERDIRYVKKKHPEAKVIPFAQDTKMLNTFNDLGPLPVILLHTAGLKVAEICVKKNYKSKYQNLLQII